MNSMLKEIVICIVIVSTMIGSAYLIMDMFSNKAKITISRIKKYIVYTIVVYTMLIVLFRLRNPREFILYTVLLVTCFLFEEEKLLTKTWKVIIVICIEMLLEFIVNFFVDWVYENIWSSWIVYELMVNVGVFLIIAGVVSIVRKLKVFTQTKVESIIYSEQEAVLLSILGVCAMCNPILASVIYLYNDKITINMLVVVVWAIGSTMASLCLILGIDKNIAQNYYQRVNELIETQFRNQVNYYEKIEESNREIRAIKHDMKNHLISMQSLLHNNQIGELDKYIDDISTTISKKTSLIKSGNTIVDAILNEKNAVAHDKNIIMNIKVGIQEDINIELVDLCIILSNSIDNAIEACERIEDISKRIISIKCSYRAGYFFYEIINPMKEEIISNIKSKLLTIKKDKKNHGFGVGNIKQSVGKYGGEVRTSAENFKFKLAVEINTKEALALQA